MKYLLLAALLLTGCSSSEDSDVKSIVGARLKGDAGKPDLEYSVVVISGNKFQAVGPEATTPVPKGSQITAGAGRILERVPGGPPIAAGQPATLQLRNLSTGQVERTLTEGAWYQLEHR